MNISFILNGTKEEINIDPSKPLLRMLREKFGIKTTKEGCGRGECGTCTVLLDNKPVASCMVASGQVDSREVKTLEGLLEEPIMKHIQSAFINSGAIQCGFCTPGLLLVSYSILREKKVHTRDEIRRAISGNICRCTGYTKIVDAVEQAIKTVKS